MKRRSARKLTGQKKRTLTLILDLRNFMFSCSCSCSYSFFTSLIVSLSTVWFFPPYYVSQETPFLQFEFFGYWSNTMKKKSVSFRINLKWWEHVKCAKWDISLFCVRDNFSPTGNDHWYRSPHILERYASLGSPDLTGSPERNAEDSWFVSHTISHGMCLIKLDGTRGKLLKCPCDKK